MKDENRRKQIVKLQYPINIAQSGGALSIVNTYPFSELVLSMTLRDAQGEVVSFDKAGPMEDKIQLQVDKPDMASYIEVDSIDQGRYTLEIAIPTATFLPTKDFESCVSFNLMVEYVKRSAQHEITPEERSKMPFEIISVRPPALYNLWLTEERNIMVTFDRPISIDDLSDSLATSHSICQLVSEKN